MAKKPPLFGNRKPDGPDPGRIQRTLAQTAVPIADIPKHENFARSQRAKVYREVTVSYDSGYRRSGIALDFSSAGVRVRFPSKERLPSEVYLHARAVGLEGPARVVWQENSEAGLALIPQTVA